jgi:long-chain acyl-CoA synthetase
VQASAGSSTARFKSETFAKCLPGCDTSAKSSVYGAFPLLAILFTLQNMGFQPRYETLIDIYEDSLKAYGVRELFGTKRNGTWHWLTYNEFGKKVDCFRGALANLGVKRGDLIAVISNNRVEWAIGEYAGFGLGAAYVPMYEAQIDKDWEFILRDCEAKILIVANSAILEKTKGFLDTVPSLKHIIVMDGNPTAQNGKKEKIHGFQALLDAGKEAPIQPPSKEDMACLIYTSGTTGNPKGVVLTHYNIAANVSAARYTFPFERQDRSLSFLPWAHSFGQTVELHALFSSGSSMAIAESVEKIIDNLAEVQPTVLMSVPRIFNKIYAGVQKQIASKPKPIQELVKFAMKAANKERQGIRLGIREHTALQLADRLVFTKVRQKFGGRLKFAASGGAAISKEVAEFIDGLGITVFEGYGLTETSPIATMNCPGERRIGSVGRAIPGVSIDIDPSGMADKKPVTDLLRDRVEGEVIVYGHNVMKGYHKRPEENAAVFTKDGGFRTGDMGYLDPNGYLYITGRIKEQYKLENGKYVVPTPLEEQIKLSPLVANVMVYGDNRLYNVALVVANVDALKEWALANQIAETDVEMLLQEPRVRVLYRDEIAKISSHFKAFEDVKDFVLITKDFTAENGMLTPSLKLKRRKVLEAYGPLIEGLYAKKTKPAKATTTGVH